MTDQELDPLLVEQLNKLADRFDQEKVDMDAQIQAMAQRQMELDEAQQRADQVMNAPGPLNSPLGDARALRATSQQFAGSFNVAGRSLADKLMAVLGTNPLTAPIQAHLGGPERVEELRQRNREAVRQTQDLMAVIRDDYPKASAVGSTLAFVAEMALGGKPVKGKFGRTLQEAGLGGLFGLMTPTLSDDEMESVLAGSVLMGAITPHALTGLAKIGGRAVNLGADRIARIRQMAELERMFDRVGLLTVSELLESSGLKKLEAALDNIPLLGLAKKRDSQRQAFREMIGTLFDRIGIGYVTRDMSPKELAKVKERLASSLFDRYHQNYDRVSAMYDTLALRLDNVPRGAAPEVRLLNVRKQAQELIDLEQSLPKNLQNKALIDQAAGFLTKEHIPWRETREWLKRIKRIAASARDDEIHRGLEREFSAALVKIEVALADDMRSFAEVVSRRSKPGQNIMEELDAANESFRRLVLPFHASPTMSQVVHGRLFDVDDLVAEFMTKTDPVRIMSRPFSPGRAGSRRATNVERATTDEAIGGSGSRDLAVVRGLMLREALNRSTAGGIDVNPKIFANEIQKLQDVWNVRFNREQAALMNGYIALANRANRAFRDVNAIGPILTGGAAALIGAQKGGDGGGMMAVSTILGARFFLGTRAGTGMVRRFAGLQEGTKEYREALLLANAGFTRWLTNNYPEIARLAQPEIAELGGAYERFNPLTDPYLQSNPPRQDLSRR
jgi:hypothetical protein